MLRRTKVSPCSLELRCALHQVFAATRQQAAAFVDGQPINPESAWLADASGVRCRVDEAVVVAVDVLFDLELVVVGLVVQFVDHEPSRTDASEIGKRKGIDIVTRWRLLAGRAARHHRLPHLFVDLQRRQAVGEALMMHQHHANPFEPLIGAHVATYYRGQRLSQRLSGFDVFVVQLLQSVVNIEEKVTFHFRGGVSPPS